MRSILAFIVSQFIFIHCIGQSCVYTDEVTGYKLYLDALENATLVFEADEINDKRA